MFVAFWAADREALTSALSDRGEFYIPDPYTFLFASLVVVTFGAGFFAANTLIAMRARTDRHLAIQV